jgi:ATP-binding cassette subfamily C (CFTR/MRP) protein 1
VTVILYVITSNGHLDAETAFTTVAVLSMVIHPANMILTLIPRLVGSFASFERMQTYLVKATREDQRLIEPRSNEIRLENVTVHPDNSLEPILANVNLTISCPSVVVVSGAVGSGKSTLAKVILGEIAPAKGSVTLPSRRIGLCAQSAWLPDGAVREVICGFDHDVDHQWYRKVVSACCLDYDFALLDDGDDTVVGSQGLNLSGGQRQRVVSIQSTDYKPVAVLTLFSIRRLLVCSTRKAGSSYWMTRSARWTARLGMRSLGTS